MKSFTLAELAKITNSQLIGNPDLEIFGVETLEEAKESDISFLANPRYEDLLRKSSAGAICLHEKTPPIEGKNYLLSLDPSKTFQTIVELFLPKKQSGFSGIHPTAIVHESAVVAPSVQIGPYAVIDRDVHIDEGTIIGPHVSIGFEVKIGKNCHFHPHSVVREGSQIGNRVILQPGAIIGSCGFGYFPDATGAYHKLDQLGIVILEDDVEIGANTTIDRSRFKATIIRKGTKIDNLCQIAHNVEIGPYNMIAAQAGIAGSSKTGKHVLLGGQVGIVGHIELGDQVMISSQSGVSKSLPKKGAYRGTPAISMDEYHRKEALLRKILKENDRKRKETSSSL